MPFSFHVFRMLKLQEAGRELRCWYAWPPSNVEWSWLEMNKSKFNATCQALGILGWMICDKGLKGPGPRLEDGERKEKKQENRY